MIQYKNTEKALSLLEVLMAMFILTMMIVFLGLLTKNTVNKQARLKAKNQITFDLNKAMDQLNYDLSHVYLVSTNDLSLTGGNTTPRTTFVINKSSLSDTLKFTYNGHQASKANSHESWSSYVVYQVREDPENPNTRHLYRGEHNKTLKAFVKNHL